MSAVRPSQLQTQQMKQQQPPAQQQQQQQQQQAPSSNPSVPPPLALPNQDEHSSSHEPINPHQSDSGIHVSNPSVYAPHAAAASYVYFCSSMCQRKFFFCVFVEILEKERQV